MDIFHASNQEQFNIDIDIDIERTRSKIYVHLELLILHKYFLYINITASNVHGLKSIVVLNKEFLLKSKAIFRSFSLLTEQRLVSNTFTIFLIFSLLRN